VLCRRGTGENLKIRIQPIFILGEEPEFRTPNGKSETIKDLSVQNQKIAEITRKLRTEVEDVAEVFPEVVVRQEADVQSLTRKPDLTIIYRLTSALWEILPKIAELKIPIIFFVGEGSLWHTFETLEYLQSISHVMLCCDYKDVREKIKACKIKNRLKNSKILAFVPDIPSYSEFLEARYLPPKIKEKLGFDVEVIGKEEMLEKHSRMDGREIAKEWMDKAERVVEPTIEDVENVAKLYLTLKDFVKEKDATAIAISCSPRMVPLRVPCIALSKLRDEGTPAACEVDLFSAITMLMLHTVCGKPAFMGNIIDVDSVKNTIDISHCAMPFKMDGHTSQSYTFRMYHEYKFLGSLTAYTKLKMGQKVTIARIGRELTTMLIMSGDIVDQKDGWDCRNTLIVKINDLPAFIGGTSGNHLCLVYGDHIAELRSLCQVMGIQTIVI